MSGYPRSYAPDWTWINDELQYSRVLDLYYYKGKHYCPISAAHNGLIGPGTELKDLIKQGRNRK